MKNQTEWRGDILNDCTFIYEVAKSYRQAKGCAPHKFPKPVYQWLNRLVNEIDFENVIYRRRDDLVEALGTGNQPNLLRMLDQVENFVDFETSRTSKDVPEYWIRITINPTYGWRQSARVSRKEAIAKYNLFRDLSESSKYDVTLTPYYKAIVENEELRKDLVAV